MSCKILKIPCKYRGVKKEIPKSIFPGVAPHQEILALQLLYEYLPAGQLLQAGLDKEHQGAGEVVGSYRVSRYSRPPLFFLSVIFGKKWQSPRVYPPKLVQ